MLNYRDYTIKARVNDYHSLKQELDKNYHLIGTDSQTDRYFQTSKGKLKWREGKIENLITHYERILENGIERTIVYRYDINPEKEQIDALKESHQLIGVTSKVRVIYRAENVKIHLDQTLNGESFLEIEAYDRHNKLSTEEIQSICLKTRDSLNISDKDLIPTGYFDGIA